MSKINHKNTATGGLDYDSSSRDIEPTDYRYSINIRNGVAEVSKRGGISFTKGNKQVVKVIYSYGVPTGNSKTIGSYEDKQTGTIIFMVRNADGQSGIYRYYPNLIDALNPFGEIHQIGLFNFGWQARTQITSINTISGKTGELLYWCDNVRGRKINVTKAELVGKLKTWTCYFPKSSIRFQDRFFFVINPMGSTNPIRVLTIDTRGQSQITTIGELFAYLADAINADLVCANYVTAEACDCKLNITEKFANMVNVFFLNLDVKTVPTNWYGLTFTERMFDEAKYPSLLSPLVNFGVNAAKQFNNVKNQVWQFRINLFYDDFEESVLSPFTQVPVNELVNDGLQIQNFNYLNINFNDGSIPDNLTLVNLISVIARSGNTGVEQQVAKLEICDFLDFDYSFNRWFCDYDFYNDTIANVIDVAYASKIQDGVPIQNNAQDIVQNRLVKGGILSGEDAIPCLDISVEQEFAEGDSGFDTITVDIYIYNQFAVTNVNNVNSPNMDNKYLGCIYKYPPEDASSPKIYEQYPQWGGIGSDNTFNSYTDPNKSHTLDQLIPLGGFGVYAAGTNFLAFSSQQQVVISSGADSIVNQLATNANSVLDAGALSAIQSYLIFDTGTRNGRTIRHRAHLKVKSGGKYILRIPSHWISFGDVLNKGPMYDLYNGREYQTTSTNVFGVNKADSNGNLLGYDVNLYELEIDTATAFVMSDGTLYAGEFAIEDQRSVANAFHVYNSYSGYVVDSSAGTSGAQLTKAPRMEYQQIGLPQYNFAANSTAIQYSQQRRRLTDHNGYFYFHVWTPLSQKLQGGSGVTTGEGVLPYVLGYSGISSLDPVLFTSGSTATFVSDSILRDLVANTLRVWTVNTNYAAPSYVYFPDSDFYPYQILMYPFLTSTVKTHIQGTVLDNTGSPISNAIVEYERTGRQSPTGINGIFSLLIYACYDRVYEFRLTTVLGSTYFIGIAPLPQRTSGLVLAYFDDTTQNISNNTQSVSITDFTVYTPTNPYVLPLIMSLLANSNPFGKGFKRGGTYQFGIRYQDDAGRECTVITNQSSIVYIPFITEDLHNYFPNQYPSGTFKFGKPFLTLTLNFKPPIWAKSYNILVTKNQYEEGYLQWVANQITYVSNIGYSTAEIAGAATTETTTTTTGGVTTSTAVTTPKSNYNPPVVSSYQAGDASNIYISITNLLDYSLSNPDSVLSYTYKAGDRLRLIGDASGIKYHQLYELEVTGYDTVQNAIIVRNSTSLPELKAGMLFEVLHPRLKTGDDEQIFYEVGESFLCTTPNTPSNNHSVNPILLTCGDTYWRRRQYLVNDAVNFIFISTSYLIEDAGLSDFFVSDSWDIGRIGVYDPFFKQTYKETDIIVSNPYITDSNLNGFNSFEALNRKSLDKQYGAIQRLIMLGDVLHVICANKSISDYIGQRVLSESKELNGPVAIANTFLGTERAQIAELGTQHPASVYVKDGYIYGLDAFRSIAWRDANDGLTDITKAHNSKGMATMQSFFKELCQNKLWSVTSGVDKFYNEYIITVYQKKVSYNIQQFTEVLELGTFSMLLNHPIEDFGIQDGDDVIVDGILPDGTAVTLYGTAGVTVDNHGLLIIYGTNTRVQLSQARVSYRGEGITIAWQEDKNRFATFYSFLPECYGTLGDLLYSYNGGELWVHDQSDIRNNFYGVQYTTIVEPVFNVQPDTIKGWMSIGMESIQENGGFEWSADITNDYSQRSRLISANFALKEREFYSDFKRDTTDLSVQFPIANGKILRSESLRVRLSSTYTGSILLRAIKALSIISMRTGG